jgi:hypothetical protein
VVAQLLVNYPRFGLWGSIYASVRHKRARMNIKYSEVGKFGKQPHLTGTSPAHLACLATYFWHFTTYFSNGAE